MEIISAIKLDRPLCGKGMSSMREITIRDTVNGDFIQITTHDNVSIDWLSVWITKMLMDKQRFYEIKYSNDHKQNWD